ncbi:helix-turn-helix domain-containing protein [Phytohabitans aurantiacus]|uniref:Transcriptional regulator n=1 Tax=Phytohabitans aurantiacus TaxID=3016789 RepID=A0ABQ5R6T0_9ACTN|nr:helix-turn-helix domain-containing protein [Phytohabitans aurantiacus]GLI02461.1 transcriptional regulator [Phytohabitans aurantiacus]
MGVWLVDADVLAGSRFRISALAETVAVLGVLAGAWPHRPGQLASTAQQRAAFRARMADDPVGRAFLKAAILPGWLTDILCPPPEDDEHTFDDEMQRIRTAPAAALRADLAGDDPTLDVPDLADRIAAVLDWVWTEAVVPDWQRRERAFEADIIARTRRLSTSGWASALDDMRPNMRWLGEGRIQINAYDYPPRDLTAGQLLFIPSTSVRGWVGWRRPHRYSVVYPCGGLLAEGGTTAPGALRRLIGPARATLLSLLDNPMSTTQLVSVTGFAIGAVGNHLKIMLDAQLVRRRRAGRSVLYYRTPDGDRLIRIATDTDTPPG